MAGLWKKAGLKVAPARIVGHCATQVYYDGGWHLFDGDMHSMYLMRDNQTVAGEQDLVADHDLIRRTHTQGILQPDGRAGDEWESSIYVFEGAVNGDRSSETRTSMGMTLRPHEALVWQWGHATPVKYHGTSPKFPDRICNGLWEYRPDFAQANWRKGTRSVEAVEDRSDGLAATSGQTGTILWTMASPYVSIGGRLEIEGTGAKFAISWDGKTWDECSADLAPHFTQQGAARYSYLLRCQLTGDARLKRLAIVNDVQMAPLTLPGMGIGPNAFAYTDQSPGDRQVRITHEWVERSASKPPAAPQEPIFPRDGAEIDGTDVTFRWQPAIDPDGDRIDDYHFELSSRPDMKWPLSMSFAKLISRTADAGQAQFTLGAPGQLNSGSTYFWHVRARDNQGVWGPWSKTWSFRPIGPGVPSNLEIHYDAQRNVGTLSWSCNADKYRIYASDEKGFTASDEPYRVTTGISKDLPATFPANFVTETRATEIQVLGLTVKLPGANKAYYRVVGVNRAGKRSGASDYAAAPRPLIFSQPVVKAKPGAEYEYLLAAVRSLGDLRTRVVDGKETMNFWDVEKPRYRLEKAPAWLKLDEATGRLFGKPDTPGRAEVTVSVTLDRPLHRLDEADLKWGRERVIKSGSESFGSAKQTFVITVDP
jgi:hypothetical protein